MPLKTNTVSYQSNKPYTTLNELTSETENIWMIFHGLGHLSEYFLRPFKELDAKKNYIISPQAPAKYYLDNKFKYVGASWLTKIDRELELANVLNYVDAVFASEKLPNDKNLILFGFSQGVSIVTRWVAHRNISCNSLLLYAVSLPNELQYEDFDFMDLNTTSIKIIYGDKDKYITDEKLKSEKQKTERIFQGNAEIIHYQGEHEIYPDVLKRLI